MPLQNGERRLAVDEKKDLLLPSSKQTRKFGTRRRLTPLQSRGISISFPPCLLFQCLAPPFPPSGCIFCQRADCASNAILAICSRRCNHSSLHTYSLDSSLTRYSFSPHLTLSPFSNTNIPTLHSLPPPHHEALFAPRFTLPLLFSLH